MLGPWTRQSVCLQSLNYLTVKAAKASINVSKVSYKGCTLFWYAKKKVFARNWFLFRRSFFPGLPNLGSQIRCAQNRYTAVQIDLKYPFADM